MPTTRNGRATRASPNTSRSCRNTFREGNPKDAYCIYAYTVALVLMQVLEQCGGNLSRENIVRQAENLKDLEIPTLLPGIKVNTSPTNHHLLQQAQLQRWEGAGWRRFGEIVEGANL
jgi:branched-chain amino acid transport system substrate-binding protein